MFDIKKSEKNHIESEDHFIAVLSGVVYLRIIGEEGNYKVMTATAGEDYPGVSSFGDQGTLIKAALEVASLLKTGSSIKYDFNNRAYALLCTCDYISDAYRATEMLLKILEENMKIQTLSKSEQKTD